MLDEDGGLTGGMGRGNWIKYLKKGSRKKNLRKGGMLGKGVVALKRVAVTPSRTMNI